MEALAVAILLASAVPRRACLLAARAPRDSDDSGAVLTVRELPSRGETAAAVTTTVGLGTMGVAVREAQRSLVAIVAEADAFRLFRVQVGDNVAVGDTFDGFDGTGGVDERNDFWRNTPGEHDGSTSGEILLEGDNAIRLKKKNFCEFDYQLNLPESTLLTAFHLCPISM